MTARHHIVSGEQDDSFSVSDPVLLQCRTSIPISISVCTRRPAPTHSVDLTGRHCHCTDEHVMKRNQGEGKKDESHSSFFPCEKK